MKTRFLILFLLISGYGFSQSVNDYAAVIVPVKFAFQNSENEFRLSTITKQNLEKAGFKAMYSISDYSSEFSDRCSLLTIDLVKDSGLFTTKLYLTFKDCYGQIVYTSDVGTSREKDFELAFREALSKAFESVYKLNYKYSGKKAIANNVKPTKAEVVSEVSAVASIPVNPNLEVLYAQATETGFQLIDKTPKVVMRLLKTSVANSFIAIKGNVQGVLLLKGNQWIFDYYQNDTLISEEIAVKF
jgi:hypothetical protein